MPKNSEVKKQKNIKIHLEAHVLGKNRRDYGIDQKEFKMDYPVKDQAHSIDETPVHNIGMERQCVKVDYRLK